MADRRHLSGYIPSDPGRNGANGAASEPYTGLEEDEISLHEIVEILLKGKWIILGCFAIVLLATALYTFTRAPEYETSSLLYVQTQSSGPDLEQMLGFQAVNQNIQNEIAIIRSRSMARRVAENLQQQRYVPGSDTLLSALQHPDDTELSTLDLIRRVQSYVQVSPVNQEVDLIRITATSTQPKEAALIADYYAEEYVEYNRTNSRSRTSAAREFLSDVTVNFQDNLQAAEGELRDFLTRQQVVAPEMEAQALIEQITNLQALQYETQRELGTAQAELRALRNEMDRIQPGLAESLSSLDDVLIDQLKERIAQKQGEISQLLASNPDLVDNPGQSSDYIRLQDEHERLQEKLQARTAELAEEVIKSGGLTTETPVMGSGTTARLAPIRELRRRITESEIAAAALDTRRVIINRQLDEFSSRLMTIPGKEIVLNRLQRNLDTRQELYTTLMTRLQEARIAEQSELGYINIIDESYVPQAPVRPRIPLNLALGAILGLMLGIGMAFISNAMDNKVRKPEDLRKRGYNVLGVIPNMRKHLQSDFGGRERVSMDGRSYDTKLVALLTPLSPMAESFRRLRTHVQFSRPDKRLESIIVTSAGPGEGKSVTSMNLALAFAQAGRRTVYVDADLRRPNGHKMFGVAREPGLVDLLFDPYAAPLEHFRTEVDDFYLIPSGEKAPNPAEILGSKKMSDFLRRLRDDFDLVVLDTPPVLAVSEALLLAEQTDLTVLVCSAGETHWRSLEHAVESLEESGNDKPGVLLNRFDPQMAYGGYSYGYGYGYGRTEDYYETEEIERT